MAKRSAARAAELSAPSLLSGPTTSILPIHRVPAALARHFHHICMSALADALAGEGLSQLDYAMLAYIDDEPDIDQRRVATLVGVDRSNASLIVERLVRRNLIGQRINGADRRERLLRTTSEGKSLRRRLKPKTSAANAKVLSCLSADERSLLTQLLVRIIDENRSYDRPGAGRRRRRDANAGVTNKISATSSR